MTSIPCNLFEVLHEDEDLLILNKPAGLVCHPTKTDRMSSLVGRIRLYLGAAAEFHLIHRLDRETSGVTVIAKRSDAAASLRRLWEQREVRKQYLAIVHEWPEETSGVIDLPLGRDTTSAVAIKDCVTPTGNGSLTNWKVLDRFSRLEGRFALLLLEPVTGRKHQLRIHLSHVGHPIVGDKIYGADPHIYLRFVRGELSLEDAQQLLLSNQALHAVSISFRHAGRRRTFSAAPEPAFLHFLPEQSIRALPPLPASITTDP